MRVSLLQLQDFEAALKQRDGIITQLTTNLQQAREEKDEIMKEFLELTEQSQKLQIQFQQVRTLLLNELFCPATSRYSRSVHYCLALLFSIQVF